MINLAKTYPTIPAQMITLSSLVIVSTPLFFFLPISITICFVILVGLRIILTLLDIKKLAIWQIFILGVIFAILVFINLNILWGREGGLAILMLFITIKSFDGGTYRDWQMLSLFSFFLVIGPLLFAQDALNAIWMVVSLGSILFSFAVLSKAPIKSALKQTVFALLISAPFMIVMFFAIPRLNEPIMQFPQNKDKQSGLLSDTLNSGSVSELILNNRQIFNAVFKDGYIPNNNQLYWRMMVMPEFDGIAWRAAPTTAIDDATPEPLLKPIKYNITLVDQNSRLPALDYPVGALEETLRQSYADTIVANRSYTQLRRIELQSNGQARLPEKLSRSAQIFYSRLPKNNPKTQQWAKQLSEQSQSSEEFIKKVLAYLKNGGFEYTLKPDKLDHTKDQADELLFKTKNGFCEHYSSAFAVAMRAGGLPARVVVGYQGGEFYPDGGFWQIRGKDAHAWTEVWQPETGAWLRVDPTSAVSSSRIDMGIEDALGEEEQQSLFASGNGTGKWNLMKVKAEFYWQQWVVGFNAEKQQDLFALLGLKVNGLTVTFILVIGGAIAFIPAILWWRRFIGRRGNILSEGFDLLKGKIFVGETHIDILGPIDVLKELQSRNEIQLYEKVKPLIDTFILLNYQSQKPDKRANQKWYQKVKRFKL